MKKKIIRTVMGAMLNMFILMWSLMYVLNIYLTLRYQIAFLPESELWSMLPLIFAFFCIVVSVLRLIFIKVNNAQSANIKGEIIALSKMFSDIAWVAPLNMFAWIAIKSNIIVLFYIGLAFGLVALLVYKIYMLFFKVEEIDQIRKNI